MKRVHTEWIDKLLEGSISKLEFDALQDAMREDPLVIQHYKEQTEIHGRLEWLLGEAGLPSGDEKVVSLARERRGILANASVRMAGAAAVAAIVAVAIMRLKSPSNNLTHDMAANVIMTDELANEDVTIPEWVSVGRITHAENAVFADKNLRAGSWVRPSDLELVEGSAEITMDSGARITLAKPSRLKIHSPYSAELKSGSAHVSVPDSQRAFSMLSEEILLATDDGSYLLEHLSDEKPRVVVSRGLVTSEKKNEGSVMDLAAHEVLFMHEMPEVGRMDKVPSYPVWKSYNREALHYLHWSFDKIKGTDPEERYWESEGGWSDQRLYQLNRQTLAGTNPKRERYWATGRYKNALRLTGRGTVFSSDFEGVSGSAERTVACWVRIAKGTPTRHAYSIVSWGDAENSKGGKFQIIWNAGGPKSKGQKKALKVEVGNGYVVGETNIADGSWHHIACVVRTSRNPQVGRDVKLYVDGQLERITGYKPQAIETITTNETSKTLSVGGRLEYAAGQKFTGFKGRVDELYVFDGALTPSQISRLYRENAVPDSSSDNAAKR